MPAEDECNKRNPLPQPSSSGITIAAPMSYTIQRKNSQTGRHTDIQSDRHSDIQTYRHTDRQTCIQTYRDTHIQTDRNTHIHTEIPTYRLTDRHAYRNTDRQIYRHTGVAATRRRMPAGGCIGCCCQAQAGKRLGTDAHIHTCTYMRAAAPQNPPQPGGLSPPGIRSQSIIWGVWGRDP